MSCLPKQDLEEDGEAEADDAGEHASFVRGVLTTLPEGWAKSVAGAVSEEDHGTD